MRVLKILKFQNSVYQNFFFSKISILFYRAHLDIVGRSQFLTQPHPLLELHLIFTFSTPVKFPLVLQQEKANKLEI